MIACPAQCTFLISGPSITNVLARAGEAQAADGRLSRVFSELGFASEEELLRTVAENMGYEFAELAGLKFDRSLIKTFPLKLVHRYSVYPLRRQENTLYLATSNPFDLHAIDAVGAATGLSVVPVILSPDELAMLIKAQLGVGAETIDDLLAQADEQEGGVHVLGDFEGDGSDAGEATQEASVVRLVNEILVEAIEACASDIHLESQTGGIRIRYRIDGVLHTQPTPPEINRFHAAIISRLKIMARLNIAEKRVPQDGRIKLKTSGREVDVRVSIIPTLYGESIVMRILDKDRMNFSLRGVGMGADMYARFQHLIKLPHGIVLVTGPTGSGKTTTLYSAAERNQERRHQDHYHRGPRRVSSRRHQPDPGAFQGGTHLRRQPAQHSAARSGRDPGGRNPRPGNRRERRAGRSDRAPRVLHLAHQRCRGRLPADGRHGRGAVSRQQLRRGRIGPAAGAHALPQVPRTVRSHRRGRARGFPAWPNA